VHGDQVCDDGQEELVLPAVVPIHVLGNDAFCIAAFQGLQALGFDGPVTAITQCITDATRQAMSGSALEGVVVGSASPVDANNEADELYRTVMETFGSDIDTSRATCVNGSLVTTLDAEMRPTACEATQD
jgi:hypothetical protein